MSPQLCNLSDEDRAQLSKSLFPATCLRLLSVRLSCRSHCLCVCFILGVAARVELVDRPLAAVAVLRRAGLTAGMLPLEARSDRMKVTLP